MAKQNKAAIKTLADVTETDAAKIASDSHKSAVKAEVLADDAKNALTESDFVDLNNAKDSGKAILALEIQGVTTTKTAYRILQSAAVNWLRHVEKFRDTRVLDTFMERLLQAEIAPRKMLMFLIKYSSKTEIKNLSYDAKKGAFSILSIAEVTANPFDIKSASLKPWFKMGAKADLSDWNLTVAFGIFMASVDNHMNDKKDKIVDTGLLASVRKVAKEYGVQREKDSLNTETDDSDDESEAEVKGQKVA